LIWLLGVPHFFEGIKVSATSEKLKNKELMNELMQISKESFFIPIPQLLTETWIRVSHQPETKF
jgi:hypothetical protein